MSLKVVDFKKTASLKIESGMSYKIELPQALSEEAKRVWVQSYIESLLVKEGLIVDYKIKRDQSHLKDCLHITIRGIEENGLSQGAIPAFSVNDLSNAQPKPVRKKGLINLIDAWWWRWLVNIFLVFPLEAYLMIARDKVGKWIVGIFWAALISNIIRKIFWNFGL